MAIEHYCPDHPKLPGWQPGKSDACKYHGRGGRTLSTLTKVRMSGKDRSKADRAAGVVGQDRGSYINSD